MATPHAANMARPRASRGRSGPVREREGTDGERVERGILRARMGPARVVEQWYGGPVRPSRRGGATGRLRGSVLWTAGWRMVPPAEPITPLRVIETPGAREGRWPSWMSSFRPARSAAPRSSRWSAAPLFGTLFIVGGLALAYVAFATPFLTLALPSGRPDAVQAVIGIAIWAIALVAPAGLVLAGANRLARNLATARGRAPRRSMTLKALDDLPDDITVATGLTLPDGRGVSELVLGPVRCRRDPRAAAAPARPGSAARTGSSAPRAAGSRSRIRSNEPCATPSASAAGWPTTTISS